MDILTQPDLPSEEEHFVASGRQAIPRVGVSNLKPGDLLGGIHTSLMCVPLDTLQHDGSVWPIAYISRATLDSEKHWTRLDLEAGSIVWAIKRLRGYLWGTKFHILSEHKELESIGKMGDDNSRVQRWFELLTAFDYTLEYRKGRANGNADFLSRLPEPDTEHNLAGSSSLTPVEGGDIFLIRACGLRTRASPTPGVGLSGRVSHPESAVLVGLPFRLLGLSRFLRTLATHEG